MKGTKGKFLGMSLSKHDFKNLDPSKFYSAQQQSPISLLSKYYKHPPPSLPPKKAKKLVRPGPGSSLASFSHLQKSILALSFLTSPFLHLYSRTQE